MNGFFQFWQAWGGTGIATLLLIIAAFFLLRFVLPALLLQRELHLASRQLQALAGTEADGERRERAGAILATPHQQHLWREYAQTLHRHERPGQGNDWRSTVMAGQFFTEQALVDTPLKTGFYRHLPGILTGIGIIGTFSGLIVGLSAFQVSNEADAVRTSLQALIRSVGHAFEISAVAITLAMVFTWVEKFLTTRLYRLVEQVSQGIDRLFDAGIGEEYLARLVRASEAAAAQGAQMRQALVAELRAGMQGLLADQQRTAQQQQAALATQVAEAVASTLEKTLGTPLQRMTGALENLGANQGTQLSQALAVTLQGFTAHLERNVGQRQAGLENLLTQTGQMLAGMAGELGRLNAGLEKTGQMAFTAAAGQLQHAGSDVQRAGASINRVSQDMAQAASAMSDAARVASQALAGQERLQQQTAAMLADLRATVEIARRDAGLTSKLVGQIELAAAHLGDAQHQAGDYLAAINQVLAEAHAAFAGNVELTLARGNEQFQRSVVTAVEALQGAFEELSDRVSQTQAGR